MNYLIQLGTDTEWSYPFKKEQVPSYVDYRSQGNTLAITRHLRDAMRFPNREEADKFMKSDIVVLGIAEINNSKRLLGKPVYEPQIVEVPL